MDFGELTLDGLVDTETDLRKIRLLAPQSIVKEGPAPNFQTMVANGQLETPKSIVELKFDVGDIDLYEIFIVMEKLVSPLIGLVPSTEQCHTKYATEGLTLPIRFHAIENSGQQLN